MCPECGSPHLSPKEGDLDQLPKVVWERLIHGGVAVDLLVTDHLMPGMSGADLACEVRTLRPGLPALIVSGYAEAEGIAPHLPRLAKPFRAAELAERLTAILPSAASAGA